MHDDDDDDDRRFCPFIQNGGYRTKTYWRQTQFAKEALANEARPKISLRYKQARSACHQLEGTALYRWSRVFMSVPLDCGTACLGPLEAPHLLTLLRGT